MQNNISRRQLVAGSAIAAGAVAATSFVGTASATFSPIEHEATGWREPAPVPAEDQISETVDVDVLVIGGGSSGLGAARSALLHGVGSVLVLEQATYSRIGGGVHGILGSSFADEIGVTFEPAQVNEMIKEEMQISGMRANERYYRVWAERSREVFESMLGGFDSQYVHCVNNGAAPYDQLADEYFSESVYPGEALQISTGDVNTPLIEGFSAWISENGGEIRYETQGEQLIVEDGKVVGAYAIKEDGTYLKVNAKAVIVSGGGFDGNPEMVAELAPQAAGSSIANSVPGNGSAIKMMVWVGAQVQQGPCCTMMSSAKSPDDPNVPNPIPFICVNKAGKRFFNEATSSFLTPYAILNQAEGRAWQIFDANYAQTINNLGIQTWMGTIQFGEEKCAQFEAAATKADTLEELAEALGISAEGLVATVERYHAMAADGLDTQFGVPARLLAAVDPLEPPFFGMEVPYNLLVTLGGVVCDPDTMEVLDADKNPIPGLYATGNCVGERFGMVYSNNTCGLSNGFGDVEGYIAGESAAAYIA
ncbi:MAG: FAD-binding protein [Coriobacteriales bacterium]|nr:FAD-binding protein [Coriobacteriales bacterium]